MLTFVSVVDKLLHEKSATLSLHAAIGKTRVNVVLVGVYVCCVVLAVNFPQQGWQNPGLETHTDSTGGRV